MKEKSQTRPYYIGGQAVIEGVMMRGKTMYSLAVRTPDNSITVENTLISTKIARNRFLKLPIVRGVVSFVDSLVIGSKIITRSASLAGLEDEGSDQDTPSKFEQFLINKFGDKLTDYLLYGSVAVAIVLAVGLFMLLPVWIGSFFERFLAGSWALGIVEGFIRITIFILYILLVSRMKEIKRVFEYHGAEHKTINCLEHNEELTVENVKKYTRLHKRCGTSFLFLVMIVSMILFLFVQTSILWQRIVFKLILVPIIAGLSYELIRWAGKSDSIFVKIVSYPGICLQRLTTSEPEDSQIEVAISAVNAVLVAEDQARSQFTSVQAPTPITES